MPKKRRYGFVFTEPHRGQLSALYKTIAHEVGHGAFRLSHTFQDFPSVDRGTTQNLMDYASGTQLRKYQWHDIHTPRMVLDQKDEDGASINTCTVEKLWEYMKISQSDIESLLEQRRGLYDEVYNRFESVKSSINSTVSKGSTNNEIEKIEGWSVRGESKRLFNVILEKIIKSNDDKISYNVWDKGVLLGELESDSVNYQMAIYTENERISIEKLLHNDYCDFIRNDSINKRIKISDFGDYLLLTFVNDKEIKMVVQLMDSNDEKMENILKLFGILRGKTAFELYPEKEGMIELYHKNNLIPRDTNLYVYISEEPCMPNNLKIKNTSTHEADIDIAVRYWIHYEFKKGVYEFKDEKEIASYKKVLPQEVKEIKFNDFIGGTAEIVCVSDEHVEKRVFHIRGENPSKSQINSYVLSKGCSNFWFFPKVMQHESACMQFDYFNRKSLSLAPVDEKIVYEGPLDNSKGQKGLPLYGGPRGFGLKQLDNWKSNGVNKVCPAEQRWNWKVNVDGGIDVVNSKVGDMQDILQDECLLIKNWLEKHPGSNATMEDIEFGVDNNKITFTNAKSPIFPDLNVAENFAPNGKYSFLDAILIRMFNGGNVLFELKPGKEKLNPEDEQNPILEPPHWEVVKTYTSKGKEYSNTSYINNVCQY